MKDKNFNKALIICAAVLIFLSLLNTCNSCNSSSNSKRALKEVDSLRTEVNTKDAQIHYLLKNVPTKTDLTIEGLRTEKRMIQATDRKMLDVQRQNEIEKEIATLLEAEREKNIKK